MKVVIIAHLCGTPGKIDELRDVFNWHGAVIVEDAAESLGATYKGVETWMFGICNVDFFNWNYYLRTEIGIKSCFKSCFYRISIENKYLSQMRWSITRENKHNIHESCFAEYFDYIGRKKP